MKREGEREEREERERFIFLTLSPTFSIL